MLKGVRVLQKKIEINRLTSNMLSNHKNTIKALLRYSFTISFPNIDMNNKYFEDKLENIKSYLNDDTAICFIAINKDEVVGFIWAYERTYLNNEKRMHINNFVINENYQGYGIGKKLYNAIHHQALEDGISNIDLMVTATSESVKFYEKLGFTNERIQMKKEVLQN